MWLLIYSHEVGGDPVGAAGDGFELHPLQVHVFGQAPLQHVSYHHTLQKTLDLVNGNYCRRLVCL